MFYIMFSGFIISLILDLTLSCDTKLKIFQVPIIGERSFVFGPFRQWFWWVRDHYHRTNSYEEFTRNSLAVNINCWFYGLIIVRWNLVITLIVLDIILAIVVMDWLFIKLESSINNKLMSVGLLIIKLSPRGELRRRFSTYRFKNSTFSDQTITKSFSYYIDMSLKRFNGMIFRNKGRPLVGFCLRAVADVGGKVSSFRVTAICIFSFRVYKIYKHEGSKGVVLFLKNSQVLIQQSLAGYKLESQNPLKRRIRVDRTGIPLWIPLSHRSILRLRKDIGLVRFWLTLTGLYRVISCPPNLDLSSITSDGPDLGRTLTPDLLDSFQTVLMRFWGSIGLEKWQERWFNSEFTLFPIGKSNPQTSNSVWVTIMHEGAPFHLGSKVIASTWWSIWSSARVWMAKDSEVSKALLPHLMRFLKGVKGGHWFLMTLWYAAFSDPVKPELLKWSKKQLHMSWSRFKSFLDTNFLHYSKYIGKLGFKDEPAGKVRVFAMVDVWTQWVMFPLHKLIQDILRALPEDATFDQVGRLEGKLKSVMKKGRRKPKAFSFDLSSATDRLPLDIQRTILSPLIGSEQAYSWGSILVNREYYISSHNREKYGIPESTLALSYAVGQPMGALSSWVMLALSHHLIIQWAAFTCRRSEWDYIFRDYIVLGDDVVIFDPYVASRYYHIMVNILGVKIGLAKSIIARNSWTLEFAKRYYLGGSSANMVPFRDILVTQLSTAVMSEFQLKHKLSFNHYLKLRSMGYKARSKITANLWNMPSRLRTYVVLQEYPKRDFLDWICMKSVSSSYCLTYEGLQALHDFLREKRKDLFIRHLRYLDQKDLESSLLETHDYFVQGTSSENQPKRTLLRDRRLIKMENPYTNLSFSELRTVVEVLKASNDKLEADSIPNSLTWDTQSHTEEKSFKDFISIYRDWVKYNSFFVKKRNKPCRIGPANKPVIVLLPNPDPVMVRDEVNLTGLLTVIPSLYQLAPRSPSLFSWDGPGSFLPLFELFGIIAMILGISFLPSPNLDIPVEEEVKKNSGNLWSFLGMCLLVILLWWLVGTPSDDSGLIPLILPQFAGDLASPEVTTLMDIPRPIFYIDHGPFGGSSPQMMHGHWESLGAGF